MLIRSTELWPIPGGQLTFLAAEFRDRRGSAGRSAVVCCEKASRWPHQSLPHFCRYIRFVFPEIKPKEQTLIYKASQSCLQAPDYYYIFFLYLNQNISYITTLFNSFTENVSQQNACNHLNTSLSPFLRAYLLPALDIVRTQDRMLKPLSSSFPCNRRETFQVFWSNSTHS